MSKTSREAHGNPEPKMLNENKSRTFIYPSAARQAKIKRRLNELLVPSEGQSLTELAAVLGVSFGTLQDLRRGRMPSLGILFLLCDYYKLSPNIILGWSPEDNG